LKKIEAVIRPNKLDEVLEELNRHQIFGVTVSHVFGCGLQKGRTQYYRGNKHTVNLLPKIKLEMVVKDAWVDEIVRVVIKAAGTGEIGDGKIFISSMDDAYRIRTADRGEDALV